MYMRACMHPGFLDVPQPIANQESSHIPSLRPGYEASSVPASKRKIIKKRKVRQRHHQRNPVVNLLPAIPQSNMS